jgi:hypothetical protein
VVLPSYDRGQKATKSRLAPGFVSRNQLSTRPGAVGKSSELRVSKESWSFNPAINFLEPVTFTGIFP